MSKSIGKILGAGGASTSYNQAENDALNYLKNIDTSLADKTYDNFAQYGYDLSQTLNNRPDYIYSVDGSDEARQRMENAVYNSYVDKLTPQFEQQTSNLQTRLANQGLSVGSEAYQRAMSDLQDSQNSALNQAAYTAVNAGQDSFSNSLRDAISSAGFTNSARQLPINEIYSLMKNSPSAYENNMNIYSIQNQAENRINQNKAYNSQAQFNAGNQLLGNAAGVLFGLF